MSENLLENYLKTQKITMSDFARMIGSDPASVYHWKIRKLCPRASTAWKIHKLTKGAIPITYWGFVIINGRIKKINKGPIDPELKSCSYNAPKAAYSE